MIPLILASTKEIHSDSTQEMKIVSILGQVQNYDWGKLGSSSSVAQLWASASQGAIDESKPYAELWLGTHPSGPARLASDKSLLRDLLGADLPYLLKDLSVNKALSIQAHPDKKLAAELHVSKPQHYKDANHKPEMALAITPFECMCGFRPPLEIATFLQQVPEFRAMVGESASADFERVVLQQNLAADSAEVKAALKTIFSAVMKCANVEPFLQPLIARLQANSSAIQSPANSLDLNELLVRLSQQYPGDLGVFAPFLLNTFVLQPGQAIFLDANLPHAYLSGDCIEAMACSDNVVRAGLTPKFRDVDVLCEMLTYQTGPPPVMKGTALDTFTSLYSPPADSPVDEFMVTRTVLSSASGACALTGVAGASILLVGQGEGAVSAVSIIEEAKEAHEAKEAKEAQADAVPVKLGSALLVADGAHVRITATSADDQPLVIYRCCSRQAIAASHSSHVQSHL